MLDFVLFWCHSCAVELFKALTKKGAIDVPFLMSYSDKMPIDLFVEEFLHAGEVSS